MELVRRESRDLRCAICHDDLRGGSACPDSRSTYHPDCREELLRCPTLGCVGAPPRRASALTQLVIALLLCAIAGFSCLGFAGGLPWLFPTIPARPEPFPKLRPIPAAPASDPEIALANLRPLDAIFALPHASGDPRVLAALGRAHLDRGEVARAQEELERAVAANPYLAVAHARLGAAHAARGDRASAWTAWSIALIVDERCVEAYVERGLLLLHLDVNAANRDFARALEIARTPRVLVAAARGARADGRPARARELLDEARARSPDSLAVLRARSK